MSLKSDLSNPWAPEVWGATDEEIKNPDLPLVTIGILSFNRREDLHRTLDVITHAVQYPKYEVLVVDNGSSDGSVEMVRTEYPHVRLHEVGENLGVSSRNIQTRLAQGKYLFSFDDDSFPGTPSMILRMVHRMEAQKEIAALNGMCYRPLTGIDETGGWEWYRHHISPEGDFAGIFLVEGGVCFRLDSLRKVEGYGTTFVRGKEGMDLGLQFFKANLIMCLSPSFLTLHFPSNLHHSPKTILYYEARNQIWCIVKYWPFLCTLILVSAWIGRRLIGIVLHPETAFAGIKGLFDGIIGSIPYFCYRPKLTWNHALKLKRFYLYMLRW